MIKRIFLFKHFVGPEVWRFYIISAFIGFLWFAVESSFVFIFQGFLSTIGLLSEKQDFLPRWYPVSIGGSLSIFILFGFFRASIGMLKNHFASLTQTSFIANQRIKLLTYGLKNAHLVSSKQLTYLFTEITTQAGGVIFNSSMLINTGLATILFLGAGFTLAPVETIVGITSLVLFMFPMKLLTKKINNSGIGLVKEGENLNESLLRGLKNNFLLSAYNQVDTEIIKGKESLKKYKKHYMSYSLAAGVASAFPLALGVVVISLITFVSLKYIHTPPMKLVSFFYIFIRLAQAASDMSYTWANTGLALPGIKLLFDWSIRFQNMPVASKKLIIDEREIVIEAKNLSFGYNSRKPLFTDINFNVGKSEILVIKGESGTGKSTLLSLILGFYKPTSGEIRINRKSSESHVFDLYNILAYVGPEPYLIEASIRENLTYALDNGQNVSDPELWEALEKMDLKTLIDQLPLKLDEHISEIPKFSTGQKQRLSFARALIRKPALLILDEATANLDLLTEKKILMNISDVFQNCTCIVVTHKNSFDEIATIKINLDMTTI